MSEIRIAESSGLAPGWLRHASWSVDGAVVRALTADDIGALRLWRNEQQDVLRQQRPLSEAQQHRWYIEEVVPSFVQLVPRQLLVAVGEEGRLSAYGGLS
jgi:hypothetical protein